MEHFDSFRFEHGEHETRSYEARLHYEEGADPPWKWCDGHGQVRETRDVRQKRAGERVLSHERGWGYLYDFAAAVEQARREGWGVAGGRREGESAGAYAVRAVEADFNHLRRWCESQWYYIWMEVIDEATHESMALGMIEYDPGNRDNDAYLMEPAIELAEQLEYDRLAALKWRKAQAEQAERDGWARLASVHEERA